MKGGGRYSRNSNSVKKIEIAEEYDVDHEITATIADIDGIIESCSLGGVFESERNESIIIKACINHLLEKL